MSETRKLLEGVRVIDMSRFLSGPICAMMMADQGAEVIKVEKKGTGEDGRYIGPYKNGKSLYYTTFNRNKKGIEIDFRNPEEIAWLEELIKISDVLIENFRPGTMEKMGLTKERLTELNPRLIVADISGFGQDGPYKNRAAFDWIIQAMGGIMSLTGTEESGPVMAGLPICDQLTSVYTAFGIMTALYSREKTGKGQFIDVALLDCVASIMYTYIPDYDANGVIPTQQGIEDLLVAPCKRFKTKDGYIFIHSGFDSAYAKLAKLIGDPFLLDEKYEKNAERLADRKAVEGAVEKWTMSLTSEDAVDALSEVGIPAGPVNNIGQLCNDPQIKHRNTFVKVEVEGAGEILYPGPAVKFPGTEPVKPARAPRLGEHNKEILGDLLGIEQFK